MTAGKPHSVKAVNWLTHLRYDHGWRSFWLFGMSDANAAQTHRMYHDCQWTP